MPSRSLRATLAIRSLSINLREFLLMSIPHSVKTLFILILLGLTITDIPGKHKLLVWIVRHPKVMRSMNKLRHRFGRPDLAKP